jgi:hypothetical protein
VNNLNQKLSRKYNDIVIPDKKLNELKKKFSELGNNSLMTVIDYLNWDKYLLVQSIVKTINKENFEQISVYLD